MNDIKVDVSQAVIWATQKFGEWFGLDQASQALRERHRARVQSAYEAAIQVQCVGMAKPIPITEIYQPTRLTRAYSYGDHSGPRTLFSVIEEGKDAIVFARPGCGKTTLLRWLFVRLINEPGTWLPELFTLRWPGAIAELRELVRSVTPEKKLALQETGHKLLLLVDGYDEIGETDRKQVSAILREYKSAGVGNFVLTCRSFYSVVDLPADVFDIAKFDQADSMGFVRAFSGAYGIRVDAADLLRGLEDRGLNDFVQHPLMLALICILKTGPMQDLPKNSIGLLRRALDTLTFRWDTSKGIARSSQVDLDGEERIRCLMRVAFSMNEYVASEGDVFNSALEYLRLIQRTRIERARLFEEIAQFYGIFIPVESNRWTFSHRTLHDFLAARQWVESGQFTPTSVQVWDTRAAYAACLLPDATWAVVASLQAANINAFSECLANGAAMDVGRVARAFIDRANRNGRWSQSWEGGGIQSATDENVFDLATNEFLDTIISIGTSTPERAGADAALAYALGECAKRRRTLRQSVWDRVTARYPGSPEFTIKDRDGETTFLLRDLRP